MHDPFLAIRKYLFPVSTVLPIMATETRRTFVEFQSDVERGMERRRPLLQHQVGRGRTVSQQRRQTRVVWSLCRHSHTARVRPGAARQQQFEVLGALVRVAQTVVTLYVGCDIDFFSQRDSLVRAFLGIRQQRHHPRPSLVPHQLLQDLLQDRYRQLHVLLRYIYSTQFWTVHYLWFALTKNSPPKFWRRVNSGGIRMDLKLSMAQKSLLCT